MRYYILILLILHTCSSIGGQDLRARVNLRDGSVAEGMLLKMNSEGVEINPGGVVKFRFIPAERIKTVELIEQNRVIEYPLTSADLIPELEGLTESSTLEPQRFPRFLGMGNIGYTSVFGKYYEGFNSAMGFRVGLHYYFPDSDPNAGRFLIGFSYGHASISGEKIVGYDPKLYLNQYSFEFGRTTRLFEGGHYLYLLMGLVVVTNEAAVPIQSVSVSYKETKIAIRLEGDASISLGKNFSLLLSLAGDFIFSKAKSSAYTTYTYNPSPDVDFAGGIFNGSIGATYAF